MDCCGSLTLTLSPDFSFSSLISLFGAIVSFYMKNYRQHRRMLFSQHCGRTRDAHWQPVLWYYQYYK
ncbi:hypothetical protein E2C01_038332 [Portunus trituberculatus]|uniref:Uncharacterized protein n=1 Tax=Portunus trituberculatus TaxID=210409 RepID=A0A5B7FGI6_PORTR|nr:hypothetical protein [Portunus trituberculatus]